MRNKKLVSIALAGMMAVSWRRAAALGQPDTGPGGGRREGGRRRDPESRSGPGKLRRKTVITVWSMDRHDSEYVEAKIKEFNETNDKGIEIVMNIITDDYANMMALAFSSGTAPDIAGVGGATSGFDLKTFVEAGIIDPLNDYITDPEFEKVTEASRLQFEGINMISGNVY